MCFIVTNRQNCVAACKIDVFIRKSGLFNAADALREVRPLQSE